MRKLAVLVVGIALVSACGPQPAALPLRTAGSATPAPTPSSRPAPTPAPKPPLRALVAWSPDVLPARTARALRRTAAVHDATTGAAGVLWLGNTRLPGGRVDEPPAGYSYPFEVAFVQPKGFARFAPLRFRDEIRALGRHEILIPETEARMRGAGIGMRMRVSGRSLRVAAVISDRAAQGYEGILKGPYSKSWRAPNRFVLVHKSRHGTKRAIRRKIVQISRVGLRLQLRSDGVKPFLRYADAVRPQLIYKRALGEFPARRGGSGTLAIAPGWLDRHIVYASVPYLGNVRCNRKLIPMLRGAMNELRRKGLGFLIRDYEGCFNAREVRADPAGRLSHHSWGAAVDINASSNAFEATPHQDPRLVRIMRRHGFTWGGRWVRPDGMHFEWWRSPR